MERRKTTSGTKRYATLDDHYNMMVGITDEEEAQNGRPEPTRPVSWHPSSAQYLASSQSSMAGQSPYRASAHGSDFYSLSSRSTMYPEQTHSYITSHPQNSHRSSQDSNASWPEVPERAPSYAVSAYSTPATEPMPWYLQEWARKNEAEAAMSRNGSTDFLPIQHPAAESEASPVEDEDMHDSGKELVGMGLYDAPESELSWTSGLVGGTGKGLKLEETWQPPEEDENEDLDDEEEEEEEDDASSDDGSVEEMAAQPPNHPRVHVPTKPQANMDGQSFFFDEDDAMRHEWWFHQLKQPSLPVRDAGLGYGWL